MEVARGEIGDRGGPGHGIARLARGGEGVESVVLYPTQWHEPSLAHTAPQGQLLPPGAQPAYQLQFAQAPAHVQFCPPSETTVPGVYERQLDCE
jgi:hypothetical protein